MKRCKVLKKLPSDTILLRHYSLRMTLRNSGWMSRPLSLWKEGLYQGVAREFGEEFLKQLLLFPSLVAFGHRLNVGTLLSKQGF